MNQELLHDLTQTYLKSVFSEAVDDLNQDFDSFSPFGELGVNSFQVLKIIKRLEGDFGTLPKTLLFEEFNINSLATYFVDKHPKTLSVRFAGKLHGVPVRAGEYDEHSIVAVEEPDSPLGGSAFEGDGPLPIHILERDAYADPELGELVRTIFARYKIEGSVSRGTRKIAPNLFIGSERRGYFNYGRNKKMVVVYGYTGPREYVPSLLEEMVRYCAANDLQLNVLTGEPIPPVCGTPFTATPFGVMQRVANLRDFSLDGGSMRRLRYQVSKFQKSGTSRTEEYRCGSNVETDRRIAEVIDRWCATRTVVNPLVDDVKAEILAGTLGSDHRLFLTYLDDVLQNAILITAMCAEENGYLMDLEFYLPDMPLGGLEFAITQIIEVLAGEGCSVLSLGGTYGCKLEPSESADPLIDKILDDLRVQNIFNDEGNLQFKNKFRPETSSIYLCRPAGSGRPDDVIDIIMMIADPEKMQTPIHDVEVRPVPQVTAKIQEPAARRPVAPKPAPVSASTAIAGDERSRVLAEFGFNPLNIPAEHIVLDLKTDSWAQLEMPAIDAQMRLLRGRLQQPIHVDDVIRRMFPFAHFVLTKSGQAAEHLFFKAWPKKGVIPQNLLFPSTIFHQIDSGFSPRELPRPEIFHLDSSDPYRGEIDLGALETLVAADPAAISLVCIEVSDNAAGGHALSLEHLKAVRAVLAPYRIPLVLDVTRIVENAQFLVEHEEGLAQKGLWTVAREILGCADAVIGSLTKDFCVNRGGIIATNDAALAQRLQDLAQEEGGGLDLIDRKLVALAVDDRRHIEADVRRRTEAVGRIWRELKERNVPVVHPAGGHCVLINVRRIPEFRALPDPVASFLAWLYARTGVRAGAHSVGMQKNTPINDLVRLAVPLGLKRDQVDALIRELARAFDEMANIPELARESGSPRPFGGVNTTYQLIKHHNVPHAQSPAGVTAANNADRPERVVEQKEPASGASLPKERRTRDIAVVGMAGRYPKARDLRELWDNLAQGRDCVEEIPAERYERRLRYGSATRYRGGFIDDVDRFDSLFFNISPKEAEALDPQERLFLEVAWEAIEDAGYYPETLAQEDSARNVGVFVGAVWAMYQMLGTGPQADGQLVPNSFFWSIANRVSYAFNLSGPSLTLDTACSSSLTALYLACEAIQSGECSAAIAGGVNLDLHQARFNINHQGGALSADGVCRAFGKGANGYVMGEGVGALFLKSLEDAEKDGDRIYGVIKSAVINHGGRTSGYMVPNPKAQGELIAAALEKAGVDARSIGYVEAHGTGTELGDPVEIAGLSQAFQPYKVAEQTCAIGSVKTNVGHLEAAAGIISVTKVLLQMKHRRLVPSLHSSNLNELIDFQRSPFYVVQTPEEWKAREVDGVATPLRAGISSFGAGGGNAHIILESYEGAAGASEESPSASQFIFPLSARNEERLREAAIRLSKFVEKDGADLEDVAYTLQYGRKSFEHRVAILAGTRGDLLEKLACFIEGRKDTAVVAGQAREGEGVTRLLSRADKREFVRLVAQDADLRRIAMLWAEGLFADWRGFVAPGKAKRVSLPTYPFADRKHWMPAPPAAHKALQAASSVHPMVDSNESTFERQLFKKTFNDRDFFIYDHHVSDIPTLPGVAYLELVRKAGEIAAGRKVQKIRNIVWISPIAVQNSVPKEVFVELKPSGEVVQFEVFSEDAAGKKTPHSQGKLLYAPLNAAAPEPEFLDLAAVRARCEKVIDGKTAYGLFKSFGLNLGPSFQVLQDVYRNDVETLGGLQLPEFRQDDLRSMILHPSLVDGSLQAGMAAQLGGPAGEMLVPFSIGEVEILEPLQPNCLSYLTLVQEPDTGRGRKSVVMKSNVLIVDPSGKVLVKIRESVGVPLRDIYKKAEPQGDVADSSRLYYSYDWEKAPAGISEAPPAPPRSLVLFDVDATLRDQVRGGDPGHLVLVRPERAFEDEGGQCFTVNPGDKEDFVRLFESLIARGCPLENVCFAWPAGEVRSGNGQDLEQSLTHGVHSFLFLCQSLIKLKLEGSVQLLYVHSGRAHDAAISGFVNSLRLEHPRLLCKALEIPQEGDGGRTILDAISAELHARTQDAAVIRYDGERFVRKLKACEIEDAPAAHALREGGAVLITGGAGGLGLIFAEYLAKARKARVVLTGRSPLSPEREARLEELRKDGAEVVYLAADVSRRADVERLLDETRVRFGAIHGVIHAAGVLRDSLLRNKTAEEMSAVLAPKVQGTVHLDELTKEDDLDFFVTFSSLASVAGNAGQCDYSFANAFMDSLMAARERLRAEGARSGRSLSLNWSLWADGGMKLDEQTELYFKRTLGISPLSAATGLDAFERGLASGRTQFAVVEGNQEKVELAWGLRKKAEPVQPAANHASSAAAPGSAEEALLPSLQGDLSQIVMDLLKLQAADVASDRILLDLGFDSIGLTTFANAVNEKYQLDLTPVLFFDYPSIDEIAKYLVAERKEEILRVYGSAAVAAASASVAAPSPSPAQELQAAVPDRRETPTLEIRKGWNPGRASVDASVPRPSGEAYSPQDRFINEPIAIVGMSGIMPQSEDLDEFWANLSSSADMVSVIPADRWRWEDCYGDPLKEANKTNSKWGGFMKEVDKFDPLFFGISPREAQMMDPQQRIFLETVWRAIEDSGQKVSDLSGTRTGLFVGVATTDYIDVLRDQHAALDGYSASGNSHSVLANRVSFLLNLRGPSAPIDTACSSSLVALHRAIESIHTRSCDMAIVGGVHVMLTPAAFISFSAAGMLSSDGKCKTFDKRANGYVRGEGSGAIFIKRLSDAVADGNQIHAVIRATAENHGGKVTTLTAPNSSAQTELLIEAYEKAQMDPSTVGFIECHGTGTSLGDPIEIQALTKAFAELYKKRNKGPAEVPHCGLSSVKTNIGHLETAAGIAGLLKAVLAIKHRQIPANVHFEELNPYIKLNGTPFYIAQKLTPWEAPLGENGATLPRRAGVSSFGFGGANAHIVLEEYIPPPAPSRAAAPAPQLIVLSARNQDRLRDYVGAMVAFLDRHDVDLADFAFTLQVGRDEMPERVAFVASGIDEVKRKFSEILRHEAGPGEGYVRSSAGKQPRAEATSAVPALIESGDLSRLAELWGMGAKIEWRRLHRSVPRRVSVPAYPFARERHWVAGNPVRPTASVTVLHPLVHRNTSTLQEQRFSSRFSGDEFFLTDHVVETLKILPGVAYLEMARAAGELSGTTRVRAVRNLVWERPLVVGSDGKEVEVVLSPSKGGVSFGIRSGAGDSAVTHCTGKLVYESEPAPSEFLDVAAIRERCREQVMSGADLYPFLSSGGLNLGPSFRIVQSICATESEALAVLRLPEHLKAEAGQFWLHPALMDGSLHTAVGLLKKSGLEETLGLPYAVGEVEIFAPVLDVHYGYATWRLDQLRPNELPKVAFHLLDEHGRVLVRIRDFVSRPFRPASAAATKASTTQADTSASQADTKLSLKYLLPVWNPVRIQPDAEAALPDSCNILLLGSDAEQLHWLRASYPGAQSLDVASVLGIDGIETSLAGRSFDQLLWIAPEGGPERIVERQEEGALAVFRIVKALLSLGHGNRQLRCTFVVRGTQRVTDDERIEPTHASIIGLVGSLAKEYPQWDVRLLDLDSLASVTARECLSLPWNKQGDALTHRKSEWFGQGLAVMPAPPTATPIYRRDGVYVVIGGAGGVGEVWSRYVIEHHQANVVWIGRRELDATIDAKIKSLGQLGPAPLYIPADATNAQVLAEARKTILEAYPAIHGVVHSAIVLQDQSLARMDERTFRAGMSAKVDVSVNMDAVFGGDELDFMLFFSSLVSFVKSPGQANYAAGCTFKDAFASELQRRRPYPVKIMNWGYWGNVGIVADESYKKTMAQMGVGSIEPAEGMEALRVLAGSGLRQMALIKTLDDRSTAAFNLSEAVTWETETTPPVLREVKLVLGETLPADSGAALEAELPSPELSEFITEILAASLISMGLLRNGSNTLAGLSLDKLPAAYYERWLQASIRHLQQQDVLSDDLTLRRSVRSLAEMWSEWQDRRARWSGVAALQAQIALLETCLRALPDVLSARRRATDVMFPESSMRLVEGIYRGNALADRFNGILGEVLTASIERHLALDPSRELRIVEIGAGTGGTTAKLLPQLKRHPIAEYRYTDVSQAFLRYAEEHFKPDYPALSTAIFDVTRPLAGQSIAAGHYDFAVAANVLHATPEIRQSLRNAKATLKKGGILLLNEIATWSLFNHLTFGLLEGWWLSEDTAVRLPGSPGLAPETWREILAEEGFESIFFPASEIHRFGQQIVAAASDGRTRQRIAKQASAHAASKRPVSTTPVPQARPMAQPMTQAMTQPNQQRSMDHARRLIVETLSDALRLNAAVIRGDAPFAEYGVDSIIGVNLVRTINEALEIELSAASLFEYSTVDDLAGYIQKNWPEQIAAQLPSAAATPANLDAHISARKEEPQPTGMHTANRFAPAERFSAARREYPDHEERDPRHVPGEPIAIVGMSGRFAESESLDVFWQHLAEGANLVRKASRWSAADCTMSDAPGLPYCSSGSFIDSIDRFDPAFFGISAQEAVYMDPQQRLFLEEAWKALEDAGYAGKGVQEMDCGVYVGCGGSNYDRLAQDEPPPQAFWGNSQAVLPARIAYHLNLRGPAIAVDTACSSSLVTIHLACQSLWAGETSMAVAGGVFLQPTPGFYQVANRAGMLSPDGKCYSFDARANGFVPGEGVGVVILKRLRDAVRDGDHIHGVIAGSGINQDGKSNGLIAPNGRAQEQLERAVYDRFQINPETIQVVEAHATGTLLGDSVEYGALSRTFRGFTDKKHFCALGTVKTNVGHAATAAGVAGVLKILLALRHRRIPPSLHFENGNPAIDLESGPFYVNTQLRDWQVGEGEVRRAAVSAFGFSGTNAHLVLEEAPSIEQLATDAPAYLVVLTARTAEQLQQQARNLLGWLRGTAVPMNDLSFSLFVGRMHHTNRLACVVRDQEELAHVLGQWIDGGAASGVFASEVSDRTREHVALKKFGNHCIQECARPADPATYVENLTAVADLYAQGYALEYATLFPEGSRRIPLPTYPFAAERYWVDTPYDSMAGGFAAAIPLTTTVGSTATTPAAAFSRSDESLAAWLERDLSELARKIVNAGDAPVSLDKVLLDLGFDSVGLTGFAAAISTRYGVKITPVLFFDYPSIAEIAKHLAAAREDEIRRFRQSAGNGVSPAVASPPSRAVSTVRQASLRPSSRRRAPGRRPASEPIAIVGIAGVMPQSDDLDEWWTSLRAGRNLITVVPEDRWSWQDYYGDPAKDRNKTNSKWGGFMKEIDTFDPLFFGISPREAKMMDPQQRIFLQTAWKAIEDSGHSVSELSGSKTGVFAGVGSNDYIEVLRGLSIAMDGYSASGNSHSVLANRISFLFNLHGPSAPIDTACSSSLVALHRAVESIQAGSSDLAIAGGVQVMLSPGPYVAFGVAGMLSSDGACKTFDKRANGYVRGEGCGVVVLKPLTAAEADGDHIYAVIRATAENHGGRVTTLTAPNSAAQSALLIESYEKAGIDPATIGFIECHGTGTVLGDPIEFQALSSAFSELYRRSGRAEAEDPHCGLGSVKTSIGHLETAAGIAGLLKALLAIKHKEIPANLHFEEINPYIDLDRTPFYIIDKLVPWKAPLGSDGGPVPRRAGVSSFGFGGANAHVVLEEYVRPDHQAQTGAAEPRLIVLSAKNAERLDAYVRLMLAFTGNGGVELADIAYTLQVGRDEMAERLAIVASSVEELRRKLEEILAEGRPTESYRGNVQARTGADAAGEPDISGLLERKELSALAQRWVAGEKVDWRLLYQSASPRRISLPTYPFAKLRCWPDAEAGVANVRPSHVATPSEMEDAGAGAGLQSWVPLWNPVRIDAARQIAVPESARVLLLGDDRGLPWVRRSFPNAEHLPLGSRPSIDAIERGLTSRSFDQLLWIAPDMTGDPALSEDSRETILEQQEDGVVAVFRIVKALLQSGHATRKLQWTVITGRTQPVMQSGAIQSTHAGMPGLIGSVAKEYPHWDLRVLDIESLQEVQAAECLSMPWDKQGDMLAHRRGEWFQQGLELLTAPPPATPIYRRDGVYVVIGGAGGVGEVWSRYMVERYHANIVWIGRRPLDEGIESKINALAALGPAPLYVSADAADLDALQRAEREIRKTYPAIHGVVHSAIVLNGKAIAAMEESTFRSGYSAKSDITVNVDRVFGAGDLDFMLFFSSIASFLKGPGQADYAAGCTFKDSHACELAQRRPYPVKTVNWGYWGNVGVVTDESHKKLMAQMGIGSIEPQEGTAALDVLVGSSVRQMAVVKTLEGRATAAMSPSRTIAHYPQTVPAVLPGVGRQRAEDSAQESAASLDAAVPSAEMLDFMTEIVLSSLTSLGLFRDGINTIAGLSLAKQPASFYERWLSSTGRYLQGQGLLDADLRPCRELRTLPELWAQWDARRGSWAVVRSVEALTPVIEACLKALPDILSARQMATDVLFPNSSMKLVEGVYHHNVVAEHFNNVLAETLFACIEQRLQQHPGREIRILEVGAGTGGTTAKLLPGLQRYPVKEYCYTDVSRAFLMYAEQHYRPGFPALKGELFDVSRPLASQSIPADHYDFAIAANVLHATPDIRETLRNTKAALKNQGILLLNEISSWSLFNHVTFGLLEGWWLHQDSTLRIPGSPGLAPEAWQAILAEEGFESTLFPAETAHRFGYQIVAAASNGWVRQRKVAAGAARRASLRGSEAQRTPAEQTGRTYVARIITEKLSETLKLDASEIGGDAPLGNYGVDSISGVMLIRAVNEALEIDVEPSVLLDYSTVDRLAEYIAEQWREQVSVQLARSRGMSPESVTLTTRPEPVSRTISNEPAERGVGERGPRSTVAEPIAVVGMSGRFADSDSLDAFWQNLEQGKSLVTKVARWSAAECSPAGNGHHEYCSDGSFVGSIDRFDAGFFGVSPEDATVMDPQLRLLMEESWKALEDAGYAGAGIQERRCGVFVGSGHSDYDSLVPAGPSAHSVWGNAQPAIAARLARHLNLRGPAIGIDGAGASSLVAVHLACQSLWAGETDIALAGGVFLLATPSFYRRANDAGLLSPEGKCYSFDARANGFVPGEGVGAIIVKRLRDAIEDGDHIHGVIAGTGVEQDAGTHGHEGDVAAQERLARGVYERFAIDPETIQVVEAHGAGTVAGDSAEYEAMKRAVRAYTAKNQFCAIGSVKANIGHAGAAAGIAGLLKLLLSLKERRIAPAVHFRSNPAIDVESSPFYINTTSNEWRVEGHARRRGAVSSFGVGGTNAYIVVEEAPAAEHTDTEGAGHVIPLSARTPEQLKRQARNLLALLQRAPATSLRDLSFTLFVGRRHLGHRVAFVARERQELIRLLEQWSDGRTASSIYEGDARHVREHEALKKSGNECIRECANNQGGATYLEALSTVANLYAQGYSLEYHRLFPAGARRMPVPTYPFAEEHYWIDRAGAAMLLVKAPATPGRASEATARDEAAAAITAAVPPEASAAVEVEVSREQLLERVVWQEASSLEDGYRKVTF